MSLVSSISFTLLFLVIEAFVAIEPILPPYLLMEKVPVLIGLSNAFVAVCNLSVTYYYPTWFQTVMLSSASNAGKLYISSQRNMTDAFSQDSISSLIACAYQLDQYSLGD